MRGMVLLGALLLLPAPASAHGGGLDANGCHHDRKNGGYHCHRAQASPPIRPGNPDPTPRPQRLNGRAVSYPNCAAARAAGAAPIRVGEPGYSPGLDRDGDGVACE